MVWTLPARTIDCKRLALREGLTNGATHQMIAMFIQKRSATRKRIAHYFIFPGS
jgi:hypothetical protein